MKYNGYDYELDYEKIHRVMEFLNWKWSRLERVPTVQEIKDSTEKMVQSLKDDPHTLATQTGGIHVRRQKDETGSIYFNVAFEIYYADYY